MFAIWLGNSFGCLPQLFPNILAHALCAASGSPLRTCGLCQQVGVLCHPPFALASAELGLAAIIHPVSSFLWDLPELQLLARLTGLRWDL
eukprot:3744355-Amphidinium_carterae.1